MFKTPQTQRFCVVFCLTWLFWACFPQTGHGEEPLAIPEVTWPAGTSAFCLRLRNACFRACFTNRMRNKQPPHSKQTIEEEKFACYEQCRTMPQLETYCKMQQGDILKQGDQLVKKTLEQIQELEREIASLQKSREQIEEQKKQETRWRERLQNERERMMIQLRHELARQAKKQAEKQADQKQLTAKQQAFQQQQQEVQDLRKQLQEQAKLLRTQKKSQEQRKQWEEERRNLLLQQQLIQAEKRRLELQKQTAAKQQQEEEQRRKAEQQRLQEVEKLRQQREAELEAIKKQRQEETERLNQMKQLIEKERELSQKKLGLLRMQQEAQQQKQTTLLAKLKQLEKNLHKRQKGLRTKRQSLSRRNKNYRKTLNTRMSRLQNLDRRAKRYHKRTKKSDVYDLFNQGKFVEAQHIYQKRKQGDMAEKITEFQTSLQKGKQAHDDNNHKTSIPVLEKVLTLDLELGGGKGKFSRLIRQMLSNMYAVKGILAINRQNYSSARVFFGVALRYSPQHKLSLDKMKHLHGIATGYYNDAKTQKKSNPDYAQQLLRKALRLVASQDPLYQQIRNEMVN